MTKNRAAEARFLAVALTIGMRTTADVERWAVSALEEQERVNPDVAELAAATMLPAEDVKELLRKLGGASDESQDLQFLMRRLLALADMSVDGAREAAAYLFNLSAFSFSEGEVFGRFWSMFVDADGGFYGTPEDAAAELRAYLRGKIEPVDA